MELTDKNARRRVIEVIVDRWIKKNPEKLAIFAASVKEMRQGQPGENQMHTYKATVPEDMVKQLDFALESDGDVRLFEPDGELAWFAGKYPEFIIPYDRSESVR